MKNYARIEAYLDHALFGRPEGRRGRKIRLGLLAALYLLGVAYWIGFFDAGRVSLVVADWAKENAYLNTLRSAMLGGVLPWQWSSAALGLNTQRFMANPEIVLTPDIFLLRGMSNTVFAIAHVAILYSAGFVGLTRLARRIDANVFSFAFLWLIFNFNGYITSHLAIGHFQWTGYFLLPVFLHLVLGITNRPTSGMSRVDPGPALRVGLVIGAMILNGSLHFAVWCCAFLALIALRRPSLLFTVGTALITAVGLGLGRLVPAAVYVPSPGAFISGYPSLGVLTAALTTVRVPDYSYVIGGGWGSLWWWEYDLYIGLVAVAALAIASGIALWRRRRLHFTPVAFAGAVLLVFSMGDSFAYVRRLIPLIGNTERVSSRMIVIPFLLVLILATEGLTRAFELWPRASRIVSIVVFPAICWQLAAHARFWNVANAERFLGPDPSPALWLVPNLDTRYVGVVLASWAASLITLTVSAALLIRLRGSARPQLEIDHRRRDIVDEAHL